MTDSFQSNLYQNKKKTIYLPIKHGVYLLSCLFGYKVGLVGQQGNLMNTKLILIQTLVILLS